MAVTREATPADASDHIGSCLCGEVTFEVKGTLDAFFLCHCVRCRKGTGSAHGANLFGSSAELIWRSGAERVRTYEVPNSLHRRSFCEACGAPLPSTRGAGVVVPAGSLDSPVTVPPTAHIFHASRAAWEDAMGRAFRFDRYPG